MKCNQNGLWSQSKSLRKLFVFPHSTLLACMDEEVMRYIKKIPNNIISFFGIIILL